MEADLLGLNGSNGHLRGNGVEESVETLSLFQQENQSAVGSSLDVENCRRVFEVQNVGISVNSKNHSKGRASLIFYLGDRSLQHSPSPIHQQNAVCKPLNEVHLMGRQQHRGPGITQL